MNRKTELNNLGGEMLSSGDYNEALKLFMQALEEDPCDPVVCYNIGFVLLKKGEKEEALAWFDRALDQSGNSSEKTPGKDSAGTAGKNPSKGSLALDCGLACYEHSLHDDALRFYDYAASLGEGSAEYWNRRGVLCFVTEKYPEAQECFGKAVREDPGFADAWFNLADAYDMTGETGKALKAREVFLSLEREEGKGSTQD